MTKGIIWGTVGHIISGLVIAILVGIKYHSLDQCKSPIVRWLSVHAGTEFTYVFYKVISLIALRH